MSYITARIDPVRTDVSMLDKCEENNKNTCTMIYQSQINLEVRNPQRENTFRLVNLGSGFISQHDKNQDTEDISVVTTETHRSITKMSATVDDHELNGEVKVETKSCGKISDLISQFNNVETSSRRLNTDPKLPAKRLRMDFQSSIQDKAENTEEATDTSSTSQHVQSSCTIHQEKITLPMVNLNVRIHHEDHPAQHEGVASENTITSPSKQFIATNVTTIKPQVKPRSFKNSEKQGIFPTIRENQIPDEHCKKPSWMTHMKQPPIKEASRHDQESNSEDSLTLIECDAAKETAQMETRTSDSSQDLQEHALSDIKMSSINIEITSQLAGTGKDLQNEGHTIVPVTEKYPENNIIPEKSHDVSEDMYRKLMTAEAVSEREYLQRNTQELIEKDGKLIVDLMTTEQHSTSQTTNIIYNTESSSTVTMTTSSNILNSQSKNDNVKQNFDRKHLDTISPSDSGFSDSGVEQMSSSDYTGDAYPSTGDNNRIYEKLNLLKSELMTMRKMDLVLLRQLINISQTIHSIHRADAIRVSRSLSFLNPNKNLQRRYRPVERQNSAPHCADRRRFLFSNFYASTEDNYRVSDSLSSFDESEFESEMEESSTSLNNILTVSPRTAANRRKFFQSRDVFPSMDIAEDAEQNYEDILRRNVRLWKMSTQRHQSVQEEAAVWF